MNLFRLPAALAGTAFAVLTLPHPAPKVPEPDRAQVEPVALRFLTSPPAERIDLGAGWTATEARIEQNVEAYRNQSSEQLESIALAVDGLAKRCDRPTYEGRSYLHTRIQALREHVDFARGELQQLPSSQSDETFLPAHARFYRTLATLQEAFTQAADEMSDGV